ncbi:MAG TPA: hypothetical protein VH025_01185, partial [Solirubrobacteraceae bacterium]|nr:hypothetical protein [Solirubrobacteraceae bacterium]
GGEVTEFRLEGCAERPEGAPAPLTQIHFQDLTPMAGGGAHINLTSGAFEIPVCGVGGASGTTVTAYKPFNFCVTAGDYIGFNDEGGFVPSETGAPPYPAGVPYKVIGAVGGATMDSFIANGDTNNGKTISPEEATYHDGFATNTSEELLLQATLGTGADARYVCPGGTKEAPGPSETEVAELAPVKISAQTDGVNHKRVVSVAIYCRVKPRCEGTVTLSNPTAAAARRQAHPKPAKGKKLGSGTFGKASFTIPAGKTTHVPVRVNSKLIKLIRHNGGVKMTMTAAIAGKTISQKITVKIY